MPPPPTRRSPPALPAQRCCAALTRTSRCLRPATLPQYTQLIARRVRENGVLSMLMPGDVTMVRSACQRQVAVARRAWRGTCTACSATSQPQHLCSAQAAWRQAVRAEW